MSNFFENVNTVKYEGPESTNPFSYRFYNPDEMILGKTMKEQLRLTVCYWHTFGWVGSDQFGSGSFIRPWFDAQKDPMAMAKLKADVAFEFLQKLDVPYYAFHDIDIMPEGNTPKEYSRNFHEMTEILATKQKETGVKLLWGTANCFSNRRYMAGAATNPDPEIFACAANQVCHAMNATHQLGGENYVLWGGREGYETLLNTDLRQEREQIGRFMQMVVEHKHKIGFKGTLLIEPKPQEPTKHQYDYDVATVYGFLKQFGLENEIKVNVECNHATLAGHSFHHEIATAIALGIFGSVDANRGDAQSGWDTDQFPNSVEENTLVMYEILKAGGFKTGGMNFDAKVRRQSIDKEDLFYGHIGAIDTLALSLRHAARMVEDQKLGQLVQQRYAGWNQGLGKDILQGKCSLSALSDLIGSKNLNPQPCSGQQERLENLVNAYIYRK